MPRGLFNWKFDDVVSFLDQHFFYFSKCDGTSHHYYVGLVDGKDKLVDVWRHDGSTFPPRSLETMIHKSGIPKEIWKNWGKAGNKKSRKKVQYLGAKQRD